ncbi:MAG: DUF547 domain-containing protein [Pseudomonadota bacterium]
MHYRVAVVLLALILSPTADAETRESWLSILDLWGNILERYVDEQGRTDFIALARDRSQLETAVSFISTVSPETHPKVFSTKNQKLAYHINAYNILAMNGVVATGLPSDFDSIWKRAKFFKFRDVIIGGNETNLYDYENKIIRPLGEPRIHFVLNCMVRACPRLPRTPLMAASLDEDLDSLTRGFFADPKHLQIDTDKKLIQVSEILDFYTEDFVASGKARDLPTYINRYLDTPLPQGYKVRFIDYDWTVNQQP